LTTQGRLPERRVRLLISAACVIPACLSIAQTYVSAKLNRRDVLWDDLAFSGGDWLLLAPLIPFAFMLGRRFPFTPTHRFSRIVIHTAGVLALALTWASLGMVLGIGLHHFPGIRPFGPSYLNWIAITVPFSALIYLAVLGCAYAYSYLIEAREREAQLATARLSALRMQLHPHFLFNTLNTAVVLVREKDTAAAARTLELLADLLRDVIRTDRPQEIPLDDELLFIERYLAIEQVRFADRLHVTWTIDERARDGLVPEFVLQPLIENAIRHGFAKRADASTVGIAAQIIDGAMELTVSDDGIGFDPTRPFGVGLTNTRERLRALYGDRATLEIASAPASGTRAVIRLPFRTQAHA
jgi:two-component system LytT family sensor kinase